MTDPDYSALALRLGDAADILEQVSALYGYANPHQALWSARDLRYEAEHLREGL